jgi:glucosamine-6-phosphate deaminase
MYTHFFSHIDLPPSQIHILNGNAPDLHAECLAYEASIKSYGGIELFLGGIGPDGHIAFNEPGSSLASRTRVKTLAYETILANSRFFGGRVEEVPRMALTVGVQTILEVRKTLFEHSYSSFQPLLRYSSVEKKTPTNSSLSRRPARS